MVYFSQTILYVNDVRKSLDFYKKIFGLDEKFISGMDDYAEIESTTVALAFAKKGYINTHIKFQYLNISAKDAPAPMEIAFIVENVDQVYMLAVESGATILSEPVEKPWGQRVAYIRDPDGFIVEIGSKVDVNPPNL